MIEGRWKTCTHKDLFFFFSFSEEGFGGKHRDHQFIYSIIYILVGNPHTLDKEMMSNQTELRSQRNEVVNLSPLKCIIKRCRYYYRIPKRCLFIQGLLICNSLTEVAAVSMLMTYLTDIRKEKLINAAATVNILEGLSGILSVPASFIKDYLGCYSMVLLTSQFYSMGVVLLGISALSRTFINYSYLFFASNYRYLIIPIENLLLYMGLILLALGKAGSNSSCVEDFLEKQLKKKKTDDENNNDPDENSNGARQMFWMRASKLLGLILGTVLLAAVNDWEIRYGFCAFAMRFALGVFLIGSPLYITMPIDELVLFKCSKGATTTTETSPSNDVDEEERKQKFDEEVKENKRILLLLVPMSVTFLIYGIVKSVGSTFFIEQGNNMDMSEDSRILIPPLVILIIAGYFSRTVLTIGIKRLLRNRLTGTRKIHATLIRIGVGLIFTVICCATAEAVEAKRLGIVVKKGLQNSTGADDDEDSVVPMSVFWLVPQFIFLGAMQGLVGDGMEGFFESELPKCMKRYASEFTKAVTGIGTILSVGLVSITAKATTVGEGSSWFGKTINRSHLDQFYRGLSMLCLIMCFVYAYVSTSYIHKRLPRNEEEEEEEDCEDLAKPRLDIEITVV